jgi:hypothetical protein
MFVAMSQVWLSGNASRIPRKCQLPAFDSVRQAESKFPKVGF